MTLYKCLLPDRTTPDAHVPWPVRARQWTPPATPVLCESGWHLATESGLSQHLRVGELWTAEGRGECVAEVDKVACEQARLVRLVGIVTLGHIVQLASDYAGHVAHLHGDVDAADDALAADHAASAAHWAAVASDVAVARAADARAAAARAADAAYYAADAAYAAERRWQHDRILEVVGG